MFYFTLFYMQKRLTGLARRKNGRRQNFRNLLHVCFFLLNFQGEVEATAEYVPVQLFLGKATGNGNIFGTPAVVIMQMSIGSFTSLFCFDHGILTAVLFHSLFHLQNNLIPFSRWLSRPSLWFWWAIKVTSILTVLSLLPLGLDH